MKQLFLISLLTLQFFGISFSQESDNNDSLVYNWKEEPSAEGVLMYELAELKVQSYISGAPLNFRPRFNYIGYEQSYSVKWSKCSTIGFVVRGLFGGTEVVDYSKYSLKGFRTGLKYGYKIRILNRIILEPNCMVEYGNLRIKDKTADSKLSNNSLNLGLNFDLRFIPIINLTAGTACVVGLSAGYLWKVPNHEWTASKNFNSQISAQPINWSGWYFGVKLGIIDFS